MATKKKAKKPKASPNFKPDKGGRPERMNDNMAMPFGKKPKGKKKKKK